MNPEQMKILENYQKVREKLDKNIEKLQETYHSFPFQDVKDHQIAIKKMQELQNRKIEMELNQQAEHNNALYNSLDIGKIRLIFC